MKSSRWLPVCVTHRAMPNEVLLKELADCGSAETILTVILKHYPDLVAPIDVEAMAQRLGIFEFRGTDIDGPASALMTDMDKRKGIILCAAKLVGPHRRFAIAHQLGHFLIQAQRGDRQCTRRDLSENRRDTTRRKEEMQANRFAAGLLMPKPLFTAFIDGLGKPSVAHLPRIASAFDVSLEAAASRYVDLTQSMCALLFIKNAVVRYARPSRSFPPLAIRPGDTVQSTINATVSSDRIAWVPVDVRDWLQTSREVRAPTLMMQIFGKPGGVQMVMLFVNAAAEKRADDEVEKSATERPKFGR